MNRWKPVAFLAGIILLLTGCASPEDSAQSSEPVDGGSTAGTEVVTRSTIIGTLTLTGVVTQRDHFQIHALTTGTLTKAGAGGLSINPTNGGSRSERALPQGVTVDKWYASQGDNVVNGLAIATGLFDGFSIKVQVPVKALLKLTKSPIGVRAQVDGGSGPFDCPLLDPIPTNDEQASDAGSYLLCAVPKDAAVLAGMEATVVVQTDRAENVLALPVEAVAGSVKSGQVYVKDSRGKPALRHVELGISDGLKIEIRSGLQENEEVLVPSPGLRQRNG